MARKKIHYLPCFICGREERASEKADIVVCGVCLQNLLYTTEKAAKEKDQARLRKARRYLKFIFTGKVEALDEDD